MTTAGDAKIRNVVVTRSKEGNEELAARLKRAGFRPISVNAFSLSAPKDWSGVDALLQRIHSFDWLVFTSGTGVAYFGERMKTLSLSVHWRGRPLVAAVGPRTAEKLTRVGIKPDFIPSVYLTRKLAEELPAERGDRVLLLRADIADPNLSEILRARGYDVQEASIYRTTLARGRATRRVRDADVIIFASPSAVRGFCRTVPKGEMTRLQSTRAVCIGPVTEATAKKNGFTETVIPTSYTLDAIVDEVSRLSQRDE